jgi:uncharacterized membrane protein
VSFDSLEQLFLFFFFFVRYFFIFFSRWKEVKMGKSIEINGRWNSHSFFFFFQKEAFLLGSAANVYVYRFFSFGITHSFYRVLFSSGRSFFLSSLSFFLFFFFAGTILSLSLVLKKKIRRKKILDAFCLFFSVATLFFLS